MDGLEQTVLKVLLIEGPKPVGGPLRAGVEEAYPGAFIFEQANNLNEGMTALVNGRRDFDLVLLDLDLPDATGVQGLSVIAKITGGNVPLIVLSGSDDETLSELAMQFDAQDYLPRGHMTPRDVYRAVRYAVERHKDLVALEENRERFRQFARVSSDRFWELDADLKFADSPGTLRDDYQPSRGTMLGLCPWEVKGYRPLSEPDWSTHKKRLAEREAFRDFETIFEDEAGNRSYWSVSGEPVFKGGDTFVGYRGTAASITKRKQAEADLASANESLARMNAEKDKFFSIIAHDLRTPFAGLMGTAQMIKRGMITSDPETLKQYGDKMLTAATRAFNLVEDLLEWSRLQLRGVSFEEETFDVGEAIQETIGLVIGQANEKGIKIDTTVRPDSVVLADRQAVNAVLRNLLTNAIKFTPEGGEISVRTANEGKAVRITVADTGIGMTREQIGKVFAIAEKTSTKGTAGEVGTGLGLILCKELIEKNGGAIVIDSAPDKGTAIRFTLPAGV